MLAIEKIIGLGFTNPDLKSDFNAGAGSLVADKANIGQA